MRVRRRKITPHISLLIGGFFGALGMVLFSIIHYQPLEVVVMFSIPFVPCSPAVIPFSHWDFTDRGGTQDLRSGKTQFVLFYTGNSASLNRGQDVSLSERIGSCMGQSMARSGSFHCIVRS